MTLGGNVCIRHGDSLDYCWREAVRSLLPVCDEVVICDGESTDGTQEAIREWITREPKIKLCVYPWPHPKGDINSWVNWLNFAREHIKCDYQIQLDGDEVLSERGYSQIESFKQRSDSHPASLWCRRYNFWGDACHLIPHGVCCSDRVVRVAPQHVWLPSDGPHPNGAEAVGMAIDSELEIFHYGFIRKTAAFFQKARAIQEYLFGNYDNRLAEAERALILSAEAGNAGNWMHDIKGVEWIDRLVPFDGHHPLVARDWLKERGYKYD